MNSTSVSGRRDNRLSTAAQPEAHGPAWHTLRRQWLRVVAVVAVSLCAAGGVVDVACAVEDDNQQGWVSMFDGKSLEGWKANENKDSWQVTDGTLMCAGPRSHLFYVGPQQPLKNFHFKCQVMTTKGSNAGIYFHTRYQETGWPKYGYECQVNVSHTDPKKSSGLYAVQDVAEPGVKDDEWYTQEIIVTGRRIQLKLNGKTMVDYTEPEGKQAFSADFERRLGEGTIALQAHDPQSVVYFKDLMLKRLPE